MASRSTAWCSTGSTRPSLARVGQTAPAWHALELQEARQVLERAPQPCSARGQHASSSCPGSWTSTRAEPEQGRTSVDPSLGHGQHPRQRGHVGCQGDVPSRRAVLLPATKHGSSFLQPCDVAVFRSFKSCIQAQASATLARSVLDGTFEGLAMNMAYVRQSSAEWALARSENKVWSTGWR